MRQQILAVGTFGFVMVVGLAACEDKGAMQKAGKNVDDAVKDLKK
jgi:hypothetical protein